MIKKEIIIVGGPGSGKSNYLARFWLAIYGKGNDLILTAPPDDLAYIEDITAFLLQSKFVPRTEPQERARDFNVAIKTKDDAILANLTVPDMFGEIWKKAVETYEIPEKWLSTLRNSTSAILFLRIRNENNVQPLDWVNSQDLLKVGLGDEKNSDIPTQIALLELLRFIDENIVKSNGGKPKVAIMVTAWDLLDPQESKESPMTYLEKQYPLFAGRLSDINSLDVKIFGCSIVGGDLNMEEFGIAFQDQNINDVGYVVYQDEDGYVIKQDDVTKPMSWLLE
ncbi:hypothetical protein [Flavobacterium ginsengiterrae]|uniref:Double-GTPase 1 domain-containing protein n=1 Tax=Flavobacterium ginsengiterrae TaxID=871695 RepID=A0ABP7GXL9_9FLAO